MGDFYNRLIISKISSKYLLNSLVITDIFRTFVPVNEKVTDISEALLTMTEEMRLMRETRSIRKSVILIVIRRLCIKKSVV